MGAKTAAKYQHGSKILVAVETEILECIIPIYPLEAIAGGITGNKQVVGPCKVTLRVFKRQMNFIHPLCQRARRQTRVAVLFVDESRNSHSYCSPKDRKSTRLNSSHSQISYA